MNDKTLRVLVVESMQPCRVQEIPDTLDAMQEIVGGDIEAAYPFNEPLTVVCNSEGKILGLPYNRPLCGWDGLPYDLLCGTFFIAGVGEENFTSLTDDQIRRCKELYDNMMVLTVEVPAPDEKAVPPKKKKGACHER